MKNENGNTFIERLKFENEIYELECNRRQKIYEDSLTKHGISPSLANLKKLKIAYNKYSKSLSNYENRK